LRLVYVGRHRLWIDEAGAVILQHGDGGLEPVAGEEDIAEREVITVRDAAARSMCS
jgi:hypothetical protein